MPTVYARAVGVKARNRVYIGGWYPSTTSMEFNVPVKKGDVVDVWMPGSGGCGDPHRRDRAQVLADVLAENVTREAARRWYGVEVDEAGLECLAREL